MRSRVMDMLKGPAVIAGLLGFWHADPCCGAPATPEVAAAPVTAGDAIGRGTNRLVLHFRRAPLETILGYFAEAAGLSAVWDTKPRGMADVWSDQPVDTREAYGLLNSVLVGNDLAAIRDGSKLTLVNRDEAKVRGIPVRFGADPDAIPRTDEIVTQIIPVRFIEVSQLVKDLTPLVTTRTTLTANESANSLVITDTQSNIHRLAKVIQAMDASAESFTIVKVFRLKNADPQEMADLITSLFPGSDGSTESQTPFQVPGPGFGPGGPGEAPPGFPGEGSSEDGITRRARKATPVTAIADPRTASVAVSAAESAMKQIEGIIGELDANPARKQKLAVYDLKHASAQQVAKVLRGLFQKSGNSNGRGDSTQTDALETRMNQQNQQTYSAAKASPASGSGGPGSPGGGAGGSVPQ